MQCLVLAAGYATPLRAGLRRFAEWYRAYYLE